MSPQAYHHIDLLRTTGTRWCHCLPLSVIRSNSCYKWYICAYQYSVAYVCICVAYGVHICGMYCAYIYAQYMPHIKCHAYIVSNVFHLHNVYLLHYTIIHAYNSLVICYIRFVDEAWQSWTISLPQSTVLFCILVTPSARLGIVTNIAIKVIGLTWPKFKTNKSNKSGLHDLSTQEVDILLIWPSSLVYVIVYIYIYINYGYINYVYI